MRVSVAKEQRYDQLKDRCKVQASFRPGLAKVRAPVVRNGGPSNDVGIVRGIMNRPNEEL
jgi:hypothetical protein